MAKYYYNDLLLPEIPSDVLVDYPYVWIRKNTTAGNFDLLFGDFRWYLSGGTLMETSSTVVPWYIIPITDYQNATEWTFKENSAGGGFGIDEQRTVFWSNHDIYTTNPKIHLKGTEPVSEEGIMAYTVQKDTLTRIADAIRERSGKTTTMSLLEMSVYISEIVTSDFLTKIKTGKILTLGEYETLTEYDETVLYQIMQNETLLKLGWNGNYIWELEISDMYSGSKLLETYAQFLVFQKEGIYYVFFTNNGNLTMGSYDLMFSADGIYYTVDSLEAVSKLYWQKDYYEQLTETSYSVNNSDITQYSDGNNGEYNSIYANFYDYYKNTTEGMSSTITINYPDIPTEM